MRIAYFVTPHGFGHAARAAAVMVALQEIDPAIQFDIFTQVPRWFFQDSLVRDRTLWCGMGVTITCVQTLAWYKPHRYTKTCQPPCAVWTAFSLAMGP